MCHIHYFVFSVCTVLMFIKGANTSCAQIVRSPVFFYLFLICGVLIKEFSYTVLSKTFCSAKKKKKSFNSHFTGFLQWNWKLNNFRNQWTLKCVTFPEVSFWCSMGWYWDKLASAHPIFFTHWWLQGNHILGGIGNKNNFVHLLYSNKTLSSFFHY